MQAITTKFIGPTNTRGSRYRATCEAGSLTVNANADLSSEENHVRVAYKLIKKLAWFHDPARGDRYGAWHYGAVPHGYVFVCSGDDCKIK